MLLDERPEPLAWPDGSLIKVGQKVRCQRERPAGGTWPRYDGKTGKVVSINLCLAEGEQWVPVGEVGVSLDLGTAWFVPGDLVRVPRMAPQAAGRAPKARKPLGGTLGAKSPLAALRAA